MNLAMALTLLSKRRQFRRQEYFTKEQLKEYQDQKLKSLREYAYANSPFYQKFHKGLFKAPYNELPVLTKSILMDNFDELVTDRNIHLADVKNYVETKKGKQLYLGKYRVNATSGTSGKPGLFLVSDKEWAAMLAGALRGFEGAGIKLNLVKRVKMAQITSTNTSHMSTQGGSSMNNPWMPVMLLSAGEPMTSIINKLNDYRPDALLAYASIIRILAGEQLKGRLKISPRSVISGSEVLTAETRRLANLAWGNVLYNMYGATDGGGLGCECSKHQGMHVQEDLAVVEVVNNEYQEAPAGTYGDKLLVTVLDNYIQPLVRYEMDDSLQLSPDPCTCGRATALIQNIQGRVHETLFFSAINGGTVPVHPIVFHNIMDTLPVNGWQVVQEGDGLHILLSGVQRSLDENALVDTVKGELKKQGAIDTDIVIQKVLSIPQEKSGKTPLVKTNLPK